MKQEFLTLDDCNLRGKRVLVRVDMNCPVGPDKTISNEERIRVHAATLVELKKQGARVIVLSHQGRPGEPDFISLAGHAPLIEKYTGGHVSFVDDIFGSQARDAIARLKDGEMLLLENVRFYAEEMLNRPADVQANVLLVSSLAPCVDYFVNDAFASIHRSQPSLVGLGTVLPTAAGRVIEKELNALEGARRGKRPVVYVLGGVKVKESLTVIENLMRNRLADTVLTGGLLGNLLLAARGYTLGRVSWEVLKEKGIDALLPKAREILAMWGSRVKTPVDVAVDSNGRKEIQVGVLPSDFMISDIGAATVRAYCSVLEGAKTIVMNSPMGRFEVGGFSSSTEALIRKVANCDAFSVIGGGHSAKLVSEMGVQGIGHVSSGGRATLYYLAGGEIPVVRMLREACARVRKCSS